MSLTDHLMNSDLPPWKPNAWSVAWLILGLAALALEFLALRHGGVNDTLSEQVWGIFRIPGWGKFLLWMVTAALLWLAVHLASLGKWG